MVKLSKINKIRINLQRHKLYIHIHYLLLPLKICSMELTSKFSIQPQNHCTFIKLLILVSIADGVSKAISSSRSDKSCFVVILKERKLSLPVELLTPKYLKSKWSRFVVQVPMTAFFSALTLFNQSHSYEMPVLFGTAKHTND